MAGRLPPRAHLESAFQTKVLELARAAGWTYYHTVNARRSRKGFPDLVLVRERVIFAELKNDKGAPSAEQQEWLTRLERAGAEVYLWYPHHYSDISDILTIRRQTGSLQTLKEHTPEEGA